MSNEFFGEPICSYTTQDAIDDGQMMIPYAELFPNVVITNTVHVEIEKVQDGRTYDQKLKPLLMDIFHEGNRIEQTGGDNSLVTLEHTVIGTVWASPNDLGGITIMKPEDY